VRGVVDDQEHTRLQFCAVFTEQWSIFQQYLSISLACTLPHLPYSDSRKKQEE
jgi:hypothetical protein